jgi:SAM-dependent methyltransferase
MTAGPAGGFRNSSAWAERREVVPGVFGSVAETYDAMRPDYPPQLFDALESVMGQPLLRADVVDVGAGTGISSRALAGRGAHVVAVEPSEGMLEVLRRRTSAIHAVRGRAEALPLRDSCADLVAYAQSFHWTQPARAVPEAARVLRPGGVLAAWWNMSWGDGIPWFDQIAAALQEADPSVTTDSRDYDWAAEIAEARAGDVHVARVEIPWTREVSAVQSVEEMRSHSNVAALSTDVREDLLDRIHRVMADAFPSGIAQIPYRTRLFAVRP